MTLGLLTPSPSLNIDSCNLPTVSQHISNSTLTAPTGLLSNNNFPNNSNTVNNITSNKSLLPFNRSDFAMSNVPPPPPPHPEDDHNAPDHPSNRLPYPSSSPSHSQQNQQTQPSPSHNPTTTNQSHQPSPPQQHPPPAPTSTHVAPPPQSHQQPQQPSQPYSIDSRPRDHLQSYDLFPEISVAPAMAAPQDPGPSTAYPHASQPIQQQQPTSHHQPHPLYATRHPHDTTNPAAVGAPSFASIPLPASSSRITKRETGGIPGIGPSSTPLGMSVSDQHSPSPVQSPTQRNATGLTSLERRKAHRAYTQKSRNKVNARFEALLEALPKPPPRLNPRSKAEILEYATETVLQLRAERNKLELSLALSSTPHLEAWLTDQTQHARTVKEVCQPILRLFTTGLEWKGAEVWAIDQRAPVDGAALSQAWTYTREPPTLSQRAANAAAAAAPFRTEDDGTLSRMNDLMTFLETGKGTFYETSSPEALAVVYRSGKPAWLSCEYKTYLGFEEVNFKTERTRMAMNYGVSDVLFVPLVLYNNVQIVVNFYNMRSPSPSGNPTLQPQTDPKAAIKVANEAIDIVARKFCSLPGQIQR